MFENIMTIKNASLSSAKVLIIDHIGDHIDNLIYIIIIL